jgi:hypothetical protein
MRKPAEPKPVAWKVEVDYEAANVNPGAATKKRGVYRNRQGVMAVIRNAMEKGVHPRHITIAKVYGEWVPEPFTTCIECGMDFADPSPNCRMQRGAQRDNLRRDERRQRWGDLSDLTDPLELPHPDSIIITEQPLITDPA